MNKIILRRDLIELMHQGLAYPLILNVAPAGSGKTILLSQFSEHIRQQQPGTHIVNIDLRARLNDELSFFSLLFEHLKSLAPLWDEPFFSLFKDDREFDSKVFKQLFIQGLADLQNSIIFIFDDFHLIRNQTIHAILSELILLLPQHVTFVISSRCTPILPLTKLKLRRSLLVLDSYDFKVTIEDLHYLNELLGSQPLEPSQTSFIIDQTQGWFVGAKLALLNYGHKQKLNLKQLNFNHHDLIDYFGRGIFDQFDEKRRDYILKTAISKTVNREFCECVLGINLKDEIFDVLKLEELFINPLADSPQWYAYHPILREYLYSVLLKEHSFAEVQILHKKAASFFLERNMLNETLEHARDTHDDDFYFKYLETICSYWLKAGELEKIIDALSELDEAALMQRPNCLINYLFALCFTRKFNQATYTLDLLKNICLSSTQPALDIHYRFFKFVLSIFQQDAETHTLISDDVLHGSEIVPEIHAFYRVLNAYIYMCNGDLNVAFKFAHQAHSTLAQLGHFFLESFAVSIIVLCDRNLGRGIEAVQFIQSEFKALDQINRTPRWINLATGMMVVEYEQNNLDSALSLSSQLLPVVNHVCATEAVTMAYLYSSRLFYLRAEFSKASRILDQLERILSLGDYQRFMSQVIQEKMRQAFCHHDMIQMDMLFERFQLDKWLLKKNLRFLHYEEWRERQILASIYWLCAKGRFKQAHESLELLAICLETHGIKLRALIARSLQLVIKMNQANLDLAATELKSLIHRYGLVCFARSVFDEAPGLNDVFIKASTEGTLELPILFTSTFKDFMQITDKSQKNPKSILTSKEFEIFELLSNGLSNDDISRQAGIALSTTKWHLKNIYLKLDITNRAEAIHVALSQ